MDRTQDEISSTCDMACDILKITNDGNDLDPLDLKLLEMAVNGLLNDAGIAAFKELYEKVTKTGYKKPFFHNIENLTIDHIGYVSWKGKQVEHYTLSWAFSEEAKKEALELARRCKIIEQRGDVPTTSNVIGSWNEPNETVCA